MFSESKHSKYNGDVENYAHILELERSGYCVRKKIMNISSSLIATFLRHGVIV